MQACDRIKMNPVSFIFDVKKNKPTAVDVEVKCIILLLGLALSTYIQLSDLFCPVQLLDVAKYYKCTRLVRTCSETDTHTHTRARVSNFTRPPECSKNTCRPSWHLFRCISLKRPSQWVSKCNLKQFFNDKN